MTCPKWDLSSISSVSETCMFLLQRTDWHHTGNTSYNFLVFPFQPVGSLSLPIFANTVFLIKLKAGTIPSSVISRAVPGIVAVGLWSQELPFHMDLTKTWENNLDKSSRTYRLWFNKQWLETISNKIWTSVWIRLGKVLSQVELVS